MIFKRLLAIFLAFNLFPVAAFADLDCEFLFSRRSDSALKGLLAGEKNYGEVPHDFEIDEQTSTDLNLEKVATILDPYLTSDLGRARWRYRLHHPLLNPEDIRKQQETVQYIAENPEEFKELRKQMTALKEQSQTFAERFAKFTKDNESFKTEMIWAGLTYALLMVPQFTKFIWHVHPTIQWLLAFQSGGLAVWNAQTKVPAIREPLLHYRGKMISAKLAKNAISNMPNDLLADLRENLNVIYEGPEQDFVSRNFIRLNSYMNRRDKDLCDACPTVSENSTSPGSDGLLSLNQNLRMLQREWRVKIPFTDRTLPFFTGANLVDQSHYSNFWLPKVRAMLVEKKEQLSKVFSGLAELEVLLGMADFYNAHKANLKFPEILDIDEPTQLVAKNAHHPLVAVSNTEDSKGNDILLGHPAGVLGNSFTISVSQKGGGTTTYQRMAAIFQVLAQTGMPWFADGGKITPGILLTALDLRSSLSYKTSFTDLEAKRIGQMLRASDVHPHSFAYLNNPFADAPDDDSIGLKAASLHRLIESRTVGIMSTQSEALLTEIKFNKDLRMIQLERFQVKPFDPDVDHINFLPEHYYANLEEQGIPPDVVRDAKMISARRKQDAIDAAAAGR